MSYLKETAAWEDGIYQIKTSDPVLGGPERITNRPTRELVNRTAWLKQQLKEAEAATPKAVKIVNDRLNAVVESAPSTLDTLNKLAKALDNNPKFAEKLNKLLEQKLSKNDNGADIPDKNLFLKNQGFIKSGI